MYDMFSRVIVITVFQIQLFINFSSANCPALRAPTNGVLDRNCNTRVGCVCRIYCRNGYQLVGDSVHQCLATNTWSGSTTSCVIPQHRTQQCPSLNAPDNGFTVGECHNRVGCICVFGCNTGYTLMGPSEVVCQRNCRWSARPTCVATTTTTTTTTPTTTTACDSCGHDPQPPQAMTSAYCPALRVPTNGVMSGSCGVASTGAVCNYACNPGYQLVGSSSTVCQANGMWNHSVQCTANTTRCNPLGAPANGVIAGSCNPGVSGQSCNFGCNGGYHLVGSATLTCQPSGLWSTQTPVCRAN